MVFIPICSYDPEKRCNINYTNIDEKNQHIKRIYYEMEKDGYWVRLINKEDKFILKGPAWYLDDVKLMDNYGCSFHST